MGCGGCAQRGAAIVKGVKAIASGDMQKLAEQARAFSKSVREDARDLKSKIATGRASLMRRK